MLDSPEEPQQGVLRRPLHGNMCRWVLCEVSLHALALQTRLWRPAMHHRSATRSARLRVTLYLVSLPVRNTLKDEERAVTSWACRWHKEVTGGVTAGAAMAWSSASAGFSSSQHPRLVASPDPGSCPPAPRPPSSSPCLLVYRPHLVLHFRGGGEMTANFRPDPHGLRLATAAASHLSPFCARVSCGYACAVWASFVGSARLVFRAAKLRICSAGNCPCSL